MTNCNIFLAVERRLKKRGNLGAAGAHAQIYAHFDNRETGTGDQFSE